MPILIGFSHLGQPQDFKTESLNNSLAYSPHGSIEIGSDMDFIAQGWPGAGTREDPYLIANLEIATEGDCIVVGNTTAFFEVAECVLNSTGLSISGTGLRIVNVTNARISSCSFFRKSRAVEISNSNSSVISHNTFDYNSYGLYCTTSVNLTIESNSIQNCGYSMYTIESSNITFVDNTLHGYGNYGFIASSCENLNITRNELRDGEYDYLAGDQMYLQSIGNSTLSHNLFVNRLDNSLILSGSSCVLENNTFVNGGVYPYPECDLTFIDNKVNGKLLGHLTNLTNTDIDVSSYGQLFLENCNNTVFRNGNLSYTAIGIMIQDCFNSTFRNVFVNSCTWEGISINNSPKSQVLNCNISLIKGYALKISLSANSTVSGNVLFGNKDAISVSYSESSIITGNTIVGAYIDGHRGDGIRVHGHNYSIYDNSIDNCSTGLELHQAYNSTTTNNTIIRCSSEGIYCVFTDDAMIMNNTLFRNGKGINFHYSENCTIAFNNITTSGYMGVDVDGGSIDLLIYGNYITWNHLEAVDDGVNCQWDNGVSIGNTWGDYSGEGFYYLPGSAGSIDHYPSRLIDDTPPIIEGLPDREIEEGDISQRLQWNADDEHPDSFQIFEDDVLLWTVNWYGPGSSHTPYPTHGLRDLDVGVHNITVVVFDGAGNSASDTVFVTVIPSTPPSISSPDDVTYSEGQTGNVIVWECSDSSPYLYSILQNGTEIESGLWNGTNIVVSIDSLLPGVYFYTLEIMDHSLNEVSDDVVVTVESALTTTTTTSTATNTTPVVSIPTELFVMGTTAAIFTIVVLVVWRNKKT
jgi:parallel beta-helix repeat protein